MSGRIDASNREVLERTLEQRDNHEALTRSARFKMFFAGLSFAILSFMGSHPISASCSLLKISEIFSLFFVLFSGTILLAHLGEYRIQARNRFFELIAQEETYWFFFLAGMLLMIENRAALLFLN